LKNDDANVRDGATSTENNSDGGRDEDYDLTEKMFEWCIAELRHKSESFKQCGAVSVLDGDVVKSDTAIPPSLRDALNAAVAELEDVLDLHRDWHPGSNERVLDLVHPSLYPVIYGRTKILPDSLVGIDDCIKRCGEGLTLKIPPREDCALWLQPIYEDRMPQGHTSYLLQDPFSQKFQWLPCEVAFSDGDEVK
jgi:hypothetical protein